MIDTVHILRAGRKKKVFYRMRSALINLEYTFISVPVSQPAQKICFLLCKLRLDIEFLRDTELLMSNMET